MSTTAHALASWAIEFVASTIAPPRCAACDGRVEWMTAFCGACATTVEKAPRSDARVAAFVYGGAIAHAIARMKYERRPDLARPLSDLLWRAMEDDARARACCAVVPVPLHPSRLAQRGFNQSALVAARIARKMGARFLPFALARTRDTPQQTTLDRVARLANVEGAFRVRNAARVRDRAVLVVDDVRTTGATLEACTHALLCAGASKVTVAVVAVAP